LIAANADVSAKNKNGATPIFFATIKGHADIINILIQAEADPNSKYYFENTPLHKASEEGHIDAAKALISGCANLHARNQDGNTPLISALHGNRTAMAEFLINAGADVTVRDKKGNTPLSIARTRRYLELARIIEKRIAADPEIARRRKSKAERQRRFDDAERKYQEKLKAERKKRDEERRRKAEAERNRPKLIGSGTGFVVSPAGHVLTNNHVIKKCRQVRTEIDGVKNELRVISKDSENDLALLKLPKPHPNVAVFRGGRAIRPGDFVVAAGFPLPSILAQQMNVTTGTVSALAGMRNDFRFLQISAPLQPGNSGGPLLDASGHIIGVNTLKLNALFMAIATGDIPQNVNFAIKGSIARIFLDANRVNYKTEPSKAKLEPADIGEKARDFTLLLECWK
jgi:S1-C subfamily serine protease